jgi:hypothetical protein
MHRPVLATSGPAAVMRGEHLEWDGMDQNGIASL